MCLIYTARPGQCVGAITHATAWDRKYVKLDGRGTVVIPRSLAGQPTVPCLMVGQEHSVFWVM